MTFSLEQFVADCRNAVEQPEPFEAVCELMQRTVADSDAVNDAIERPTELTRVGDIAIGFDKILYEDDRVTVFLVDTEPGHLQPPHDHQMHAVIGVYEGIEHNRFFKRKQGALESAGEKDIGPGDVLRIHPVTIHAISAGASKPCRALHVYLGGLSDVDRSLFDPKTGREEPMTAERYDGFIQRV